MGPLGPPYRSDTDQTADRYGLPVGRFDVKKDPELNACCVVGLAVVGLPQHLPSENQHDPHVTDWIKRRAVREDESAIVYLWLKSYAHSAYGKSRGAQFDAALTERAYWREHAPVVEWLLDNADVEVLCDPEHAEHREGDPAVIWAFACTSGDTVHYVCVKRSAVQAGFAAEMVRDLLGDRLDRAVGCTHEIPDLRRGVYGQPPRWYPDTLFFARSFIPARAA